MDKLEWWVILPKGKELTHNVFNSNRFRGALMDLKYRSKKDPAISLEDGIRHCLMYAYWCKAEYEIIAHSLFDSEDHKVDVYTQVMLNYDAFYRYCIKNWSHIPTKSYTQQMKEK